jgi:phenylalanyl-tRNA synthetase beta chain
MDVEVPPYRGDVLHAVDVIEDVAIGYGYNNIQPILPKIPSIGKQSDIEKLSRRVRELMIGFDMQEIMGFILTNNDNQFRKMNVSGAAIEILNPTSSEYSSCRTWILPDLMRVLSLNKHRDYPQKIFEIGDCILMSETSDTRTRTVRKLAGAVSYSGANLTELKSIVESVLCSLGYAYEIRELSHPSFIESRCGEIIVDGKQIGLFGEVHPQILENWKLENPVIAFEMKIY